VTTRTIITDMATNTTITSDIRAVSLKALSNAHWIVTRAIINGRDQVVVGTGGLNGPTRARTALEIHQLCIVIEAELIRRGHAPLDVHLDNA
jgi:hypothetical protein